MKKMTRIEPTTVQQVGDRFKRDIVIKHFRDDDGGLHEYTTWGGEGDRAAGVVGLTKDKQVIVSYQFRGGPERWMYDIPGGHLEKGEDEQAGALREFHEETGYVSDNVTLLGNTCREAYTNMTWSYYLALDCYLSASGQSLDEEEKSQGLEVRLISIDEFIGHAMRDEMTDLAAVLFAYDKLRELRNG